MIRELVLWIIILSEISKFGNCITQKNEVIVISDTHIGSDMALQESTIKSLHTFLGTLTSENTSVLTLVLNGDVLDLWNVAWWEFPIEPNKLFLCTDYHGRNIQIFTNLLKGILLNGIEIKYIAGNHDIFMTQKYLNLAGLEGIQFYENRYVGGNYEISHGHEFDLFNQRRPDGLYKPWAYYLTRVRYSIHNMDNEKHEQLETGSLLNIPCDMLLGNKDFLELVQDSNYLYKVGLNIEMGSDNIISLPKYEKYKNVNVKGGNWNSYNGMNTTFAEAAEFYRNTIRLFIENEGMETTKEKFLVDSCDDFKNYEYFIEKTSKKVFIMGHTHKPKLFKLNSKDDEIIYANSGCWLDNKEYFSAIRFYLKEKEDETDKIELCKFNTKTNRLEIISSLDV